MPQFLQIHCRVDNQPTVKMLKILATAFLVLFTLQCVSSQRVDYRLNRLNNQRSVRAETGEGETGGETPNPPPTCKSPGFFCPSCTELYACMYIGGVYKSMRARTCLTTESCHNGNCTTAPNPECSGVLDVDFICNSVGIFPDPFDCKKFHMCCPDATGSVVGKGAVGSCSANYSYNAKTTFCDKKIVANTCGVDYPVPICTSVGQSAPLKENLSLFYLCLPHAVKEEVLYPYLFACDNGGLYDSKTLTCK